MKKNRLEISRKDKKIAGVCGGIAKYLDLDSSLVRICFAILSLIGPVCFLTIIIYILLWAVLPLEEEE